MEPQKDQNEKNVKVFVGDQEMYSTSEKFERGKMKTLDFPLDFQLSGDRRVKNRNFERQNISPESE
jgi:hypothetical protein